MPRASDLPTYVFEGSEAERVERWRLRVLLEAGYPLDYADLHRAVRLAERIAVRTDIEAGCRFEVAADILL